MSTALRNRMGNLIFVIGKSLRPALVLSAKFNDLYNWNGKPEIAKEGNPVKIRKPFEAGTQDYFQ